MTEAIEKYDGSTALNIWGSEKGWELAQRMAKALSSSSLVPDVYRGNIPNTLIAMEVANRIDASVFAVMKHLYIVHGKPAFEATFLIATVNACGRFSPLRYRQVGKEGSDSYGLRAWAKEKETGEECIGPAVTIKMAKDEGWIEKNGSKWKTMPELMLHYRAAAFWTRIYSPELSLGMHTADEVSDWDGPMTVDASVVEEQRTGIDGIKARLRENTEQPNTRLTKPQKEPEPDPEPQQTELPTEDKPVDVYKEIKALAKEMWGNKADEALEHHCKSNAGAGLNYLTDEDAERMLDLMVEMHKGYKK